MLLLNITIMTAPLANQDKDAIALDPNFSTTRLVTREKPVIVNDPSSKVQSVLFLPPNPERKGEGGLRTKGYFKRSYDEASGLSDNSPLPLVTIITVVFNGEKYLEQTIQSVINQTYDNVEYIIIDGCSTDGTVDIIRKYEDKIDYWVSEPDEGLYFALNKAISLATGEVIGIINSSDWYEPDGIQNSVLALNYYNLDYIYGRVYLLDQEGNRIGIFYPVTSSQFDRAIYYVQPYPHISAFVNKEIYLKEGAFKTHYKASGDHEFSLRIYMKNYKGFDIGKVIGNIRPGGLSGTTIAKKESRYIAISYGANKIHAHILYWIYITNSYLARVLPKPLVKHIKKLKKSKFQYS